MDTIFGEVWRSSKSTFWDEMWAKHKDSPMTERMRDIASRTNSVCEVGCGHGHFLKHLLKSGWHGRFAGFEMSQEGADRVQQICDDAGIEGQTFSGDFIAQAAMGSLSLPMCDASLCRGVVQHQSHWMPMVIAMLRIAPVVVVGIGYVSSAPYHHGKWKTAGHYDIQISPHMLELEARAAGLSMETEMFTNEVRKCQELLAVFSRS